MLWDIAPVAEWVVRSNEDRLSSALLGLLIAGLLYGGLHLLAWQVPFASRAERILWRFSGIFIITAGVCFAVLKGSFSGLFERSTNILVSVGFVF